MRVFTLCTHFEAVSTEAMRIKCLAQGHSILMQPWFELSISVSRNLHLNHMTNMLLKNTLFSLTTFIFLTFFAKFSFSINLDTTKMLKNLLHQAEKFCIVDNSIKY